MPRYKKIPKEFTQQSILKASLMIAHRLSGFITGLFLLSVLLNSNFLILLKIVLSLPLIAFSAVCLHNMGLLGHEGTHFTLAKNRKLSAYIGTFFSSMVPFHFNTGFALSHAQHHWHTNSEKDPDLDIFTSFNNFWKRFFLARSKASRVYFFETLGMARGNFTHPNQVGMKSEDLKKLAQFNLVSSLIFLVIYASLIISFPLSFGLAFILVYFSAVFLSGLRPYMEHVETDKGEFTRARTFSSPLMDYVFGTINYHQAHHMYPTVPGYNLPRLQKYLIKEGYFTDQTTVEETSFLNLLKTVSKGRYGI